MILGSHNSRKDLFFKEYSRGFLSISNAYKFKYDFCVINSSNKEAELYPKPKHISKTLRNLGLEIFTIKPSFKNRTFWSQGTVAISKFNKNKLKPNFNFEKLSLMEEEHLLTKASIPYRDQDLNSSKDDIIKRRLDEQLFSNLLTTNKWREKWGMTKLSIKS